MTDDRGAIDQYGAGLDYCDNHSPAPLRNGVPLGRHRFLPFLRGSVDRVSAGIGFSSLQDVLSRSFWSREARRARRLDRQNDYLGANGDTVVEIDDVVVSHADAAARHELAD